MCDKQTCQTRPTETIRSSSLMLAWSQQIQLSDRGAPRKHNLLASGARGWGAEGRGPRCDYYYQKRDKTTGSAEVERVF